MQADAALEHCLLSNWSLGGLKPYMRNSLAGRYQRNSETVAAHGSCSSPGTGAQSEDEALTDDAAGQWNDGEAVVRDAMERLRGNSHDLKNILDPWHRIVGVGLAWSGGFYAVHLHFEGDYITFDDLPSISADRLFSIEGSLRNGVSLPTGDDLLIDIFYDPPPENLTPGQLSGTNCYVYGATGFAVAALRPRAPPGLVYESDRLLTYGVVGCVDPYSAPADTPPPEEFLSLPSPSLKWEANVIPWVDARSWNVSDHDFSVTADLGTIVDEHGSGIYTVLVWAADVLGGPVQVGTYSMIVDIDAP